MSVLCTLSAARASHMFCLLHAQDDAKNMVPVSINELLLRGCTLKNSGFILGLVVYTGAETRIQMNSTAPPRKQGVHPSCLCRFVTSKGCAVFLAGRVQVGPQTASHSVALCQPNIARSRARQMPGLNQSETLRLMP